MNKSKLLLTTFVAATLSFSSAYACFLGEGGFASISDTICPKVQYCYRNIDSHYVYEYYGHGGRGSKGLCIKLCSDEISDEEAKAKYCKVNQ